MEPARRFKGSRSDTKETVMPEDKVGADNKPGEAAKATSPQRDIQGEGNYDAARKFDADERAFIAKGDVDRKAREAADALKGPEAEDLEKARRETGEGKTH
jgi:hypothetical protein